VTNLTPTDREHKPISMKPYLSMWMSFLDFRLLLFFVPFSFLLCCKKTGGNSNNESGSSNQWFFKCNVDSIATNMGGDFANGFGINPTGGVATNTFEGGGSYGTNSTGICPGVAIGINSACNTEISDPCLTFQLSFKYLAVGSYTITNTDPLSNGMELTTSASAYYGTNNIYYRSTGSSNPSTSLTLNITYVGKIGENVSGNFSGTVLKIATPVNYMTPQVVKISGSFNVYREN
jgi:hypothetical protein